MNSAAKRNSFGSSSNIGNPSINNKPRGSISGIGLGAGGIGINTASLSAGGSSGGSFAFSNVLLSDEQAMATWSSLRVAISEIQHNNASKLRFEELYRNAYTLVLHKYGELLYAGVQEAVTRQLELVSSKVEKSSGDRLVEVIVKEFADHKVIMTMIKDILMYMDKTFCKTNKLVPVYDLGLLLFRDTIVRNSSIHSRLKQNLLDTIHREREGELIDRSTLKSALSMLVDVNVHSLEVYQVDFETDFLTSTRLYYASEAAEYYNNNTCPDYLRKVEARVNEEESRAEAYLHASTRPKLRSVIQEELIGKYAKLLVEDEKTGCKIMMKQGRTDDLARMYKLFSIFWSFNGKRDGNNNLIQNSHYNTHNGQINSIHNSSLSSSSSSSSSFSSSSSSSAQNHLSSSAKDKDLQPVDYIREAMSSLIRTLGSAIISDKENLRSPRLFVQSVLDLRHQYGIYVEKSFYGDRSFIRSLKDSLEYFINFDSRAAQYLSLYVDEMMKKGVRGISEVEGEQVLNGVMTIFRYLQDKDIFEDYYKQQLSTRLLTASSLSTEIEKSMIAKLKAESGHQFTSRLEGMYKDMELSKQLMKNYVTANNQINNNNNFKSNLISSSTSSSSSSTSSVGELSVQVLTQGFWPMPPSPSIKLPTSAQQLVDSFTRYYTSIHTGRRLTWQTALGSAELRCQFECGKRELIVHTYQMCILMLYNASSTYTFDEIKSLTAIPETELVRHLLSLAHPTVRILKKSPNTKTLAPDHTFSYNYSYTSKMYRNKIALLSKAAVAGALPSLQINNDESSIDSHTPVPPAVIEARKNRVEAALVRIMKSRKLLDHNSLVAEVVKQLSNKFPVDITFVKKRIESLIEREYLKRDETDRRMYHYLA